MDFYGVLVWVVFGLLLLGVAVATGIAFFYFKE